MSILTLAWALSPATRIRFALPGLLLLLSLIAGAQIASAQSFSTPLTYFVGDNPNGGTSGDFNGDNKPDLAIGNVLNRNVSVLLNKGDGTFNDAVNYGVDFNPETVAAADLNNDGKVDLAVGNFLGGATSSGNISVLLGNGNGTFQTAVNYNASSPISLKAVDLNGDGKLDLAAASWTADSASVLLGNGDGTFQAVTTYSAGTQPRGISVADFNGDAKPDLAVTNFSSNNVSILLGNGNGTFQAPLNFSTPGGIGIAASDLNADGKQDLVVASVQQNAALVLLGNGNGSFQTAVSYSVGLEPQHLELADFNGDALTDVVVVNANSASFSVLRGNGDGTFQSAVTQPSRSGSFSPIVNDFDVDGKPDLAILSNSLDVVDVRLNSPTAHGVAITATAATPATGVLVATFKDYDTSKTAGSFTATIDWGDGTASTAGTISANGSGGFNVNGTHTYAKEGTFNLSVRIADMSGNFAVATATATVADAPLTAMGKPISATRGIPFSALVATFTDADPTGNVTEFSATINWGDGTNSAGIINANGSGGFDVAGSHTYGIGGSLAVVVTIQDVGGSTATANSTANVFDPPGGVIVFSSPDYNVQEIAGSILLTVNRSADTTRAVTVDYFTTDLTADGRKDYIPTRGTLRFAAGETGKALPVLVNVDAFTEGSEFVQVVLSNPTGGAVLGEPAGTTLRIDNTPWTPPPANPLDRAGVFVRQHYHDFLNRDAGNDPDGLNFWTNQITECQQPGATCNAAVRRINVSAAFFLSIEFQETGYLVERLYKTAYGDATGTSNFGPTHQLSVPIVRLNEFLPDSQEIGRGLVVNSPGWEQVLENNKVAFILQFVQRPRFAIAFPTSLTPAQFVDMLFVNAGVTPSASERTSIINEFGGAGTSTDAAARARALRRVAENSALNQAEKNKAFVLMQYFGYLRRNPNDPQDTDYSGYDFWLTKLNQFNGNFVNADMVQAFIDSGEYRGRFGP